MPVWNTERFLRAAMESVLRQSFESFELVVIDDGSADGTGEVARGYGDARVRVVKNETRRGVVYALNRGIGLARGEYIARMDGDDVSHPNRFEAQVRFLDSWPDIALVGSCANVIDENGTVMRPMRVPTSTREIDEVLLRRNVFIHPTVMFRKGAVLEMGGYRTIRNADAAQDYDLWLRLVERYPLANLPELLVDYRMHEGQVSVRNLLGQLRSADAARRMAANRRRKVALPRTGPRGLRTIERLRGEPGSLGGDCLFFYRMYRNSGKGDIALRLARRALWSSPLSRQAWDGAHRELGRQILRVPGVRTLRSWLAPSG